MSRAGALPVDPSNAAALEAWDGSEGEYWAENERIYEGSLSRYRQAFFAASHHGAWAFQSSPNPPQITAPHRIPSARLHVRRDVQKRHRERDLSLHRNRTAV